MSTAVHTERETHGAIDVEEQQQYLTFVLGGETFATSILCVKEIIEYNSVTAVPTMPSCVRGVINLRGRVVPVVDLSLRFGRNETVPARRTCIVIVEVAAGEERQDLGIMIDAVNQVLEIPPEDIEPAPSFGGKLSNDFIQGMGKVDGKFVIILNVDRVLSMDDLAQLVTRTPGPTVE